MFTIRKIFGIESFGKLSSLKDHLVEDVKANFNHSSNFPKSNFRVKVKAQVRSRLFQYLLTFQS